jgi:ketosteroid isomerase-like protein
VASNLEILAPLLEAVRVGEEEGLTPEDARGLRRMAIEAALREVADPDVECVMVGPDPRFAIEARGIEGFLESWRDWLSPFEHWRLELDDVIESGDRVVTLIRQFGTPKGSTAEVENAGAAVWFIRDGRLARVEFHLDREVALRSAGLAEPGVATRSGGVAEMSAAVGNAERTRIAFEAIAERGLDAALEFMHPEVAFEPPEEALERRGNFKGHAAVRERWNVLFDPFEDLRLIPEEFVEAGPDTVVAVFQVSARGRASGVPVDMRQALVITFEDGKARRLKAYLDPDEAKRAAGLQPGRV